MRLLSENQKTTKEKTYDRMLQLPTVVKKLYSKEKQKLKKSRNGYSWVWYIQLGLLKLFLATQLIYI